MHTHPLTHVDMSQPDPVPRLAVPRLDGPGELKVPQRRGHVLPPPLEDPAVELDLGAVPADLKGGENGEGRSSYLFQQTLQRYG